MERKLVKQGDVTLMVSLPSKWIKHNSLKQGDAVHIEIKDDNSLNITGKGTSTVKSIELTVTKDALRTAIASAYKAGYEEIVLHSDVSLEEINIILMSFTGLEIVMQGKGNYTLKSFLSQTDTDTEKLILKLFQLTKYVADMTWNEWQTANIQEMKTLVKLNTMKLRDHCLRMIHLHGYGGDKTYDYYDFVTVLEKTAAAYYALTNDIVSKKVKKNQIAQELILQLDALYKSYMARDFAATENIRIHLQKSIFVSIGKLKDASFQMHCYYIYQLSLHLTSRILSLSC